MAKTPTFPTLFDDVLQFSVTDLKKWSYLKSNQYKSGVITWSRNSQKTGSISIAVNSRADSPYLELDYTHNGQPINYRVQLVTVPSNIGKGWIWYFLCPHTGKRCRKLYSVGAKFLHREAFTGCMYESQTYSQKNRVLFRMYEKAFGSDGLYEQLSRKHFRRTYAGKPTKRFVKLIQQIRESKSMI
ncbi:hypothetical protein [Pontibacter ruber]|uniref:Uncharacterized protein n=1 Tax=Pontibacter ruber TaxID=1343895 RepID=A0ABW5CX04_9BACT|nr:hypothetical protein [Pontibacter ruber]